MPLNAQQRREEFIALMKKAGWSAADTSRHLEMSEGSISGYVNKKTSPPLKTLKHMRNEVRKYVEGDDESSGKNLEHLQNAGVTNTTARGFPPTRTEREEVFSIHDQPGGKKIDDPELDEAIKRLQYLTHADAPSREHILKDIEWAYERALANAKAKK